MTGVPPGPAGEATAREQAAATTATVGSTAAAGDASTPRHAGLRRTTSAPASRPLLGVLGGGQLGRMFVHSAQAQGFRVAVLEPDAASPAGAAADVHLRAAYDDAAALDEMARLCTAVTTEFENVPAAALRRLAAAGCTVAPSAEAVEVCQHRGREKAGFRAAGVACAPHATVVARSRDGASARGSEVLPHRGASPAVAGSRSDAPGTAVLVLDHSATADGAPPSPLDEAEVARLLPGILKTARLGYDGKGQAPVATPADLAAAHAALGGVECVLEKRLPLACEISVVVARGADGRCVHLPVQQNLHRGGILACTQVPAPGVDDATAAQAVGLAQRLAGSLGYVGVLCVEFFVLDDGSLVANEMAPRPHNSGHASLDACDLSQFDLQVRTLASLPLVPPRLHSPAVMLNLLGDLWFDGAGVGDAAGAPVEPDWPAVLELPGVHLHLYGKSEPRRGRKMGHLTVTAADAATARATAQCAAGRLGLAAPF